MKKINTILYYNQWTGWDNSLWSKFFKELTMEDLRNMKPGDEIWKDVDPIHPNGKVYGYLCYTFKKFENGFVYYGDGNYTSRLSEFYIVIDRAGFEKFVTENPLASDIYGESGRMATAIMDNIQNSINSKLN